VQHFFTSFYFSLFFAAAARIDFCPLHAACKPSANEMHRLCWTGHFSLSKWPKQLKWSTFCETLGRISLEYMK